MIKGNKIFYFALLCVANLDLTAAPSGKLRNPTSADCLIEINSIRDVQVDENELKWLNYTIQRCQFRALDFSLVRISKNEPGGEKLNDLTQYLFTFLVTKPKLNNIEIQIVEASGISVEFKLPHFESASEITVGFFLIHFRLFNSNGRIEDNCSSLLSETSPFRSDQPIALSLERRIKYYPNTCQEIFIRASISELSLNEVINSMVRRNLLIFAPTEHTLDCSIDSLNIFGYEIKFDSHLFPLATFKKTSEILIYSNLNSFQASSLQQSMVQFISLSTSRLKRFFHNNPNWLDQANQRATNKTLLVDFRGTSNNESVSSNEAHIDYISEIESERGNLFEDSSFCLFYQIERKSLNVKFFGILAEKVAQKNCTCLLFWLFSRHWAQADFSAYYYADLGLCEREQDALAKQCDFDKMAQRCSIEPIKPLNYRTVYDTVLDLEFFKYLADVWLLPLTSLLGIMANYLVIKTFRKIKRSPEYRKNKLTDKSRFMWEYTYFNSWFILFHATILACSPLTTCIEVYGIYCSSFISTDLFRPFYLFVESFLGNTFRLAANMSSTLFVLFRFSLNADRFSWFRELKPSVSLVCLIVLSSSISIITLFGNEKFSVRQLSEASYHYFLETEAPVLLSSLPVKVAYFLNKLAGTTLFTLLNMFIDLRLLYILRTKNVQRPKEEAENRITQMIILNGLFSFLFRLPEMVSVCLLIAFYFDQLYFPLCLLTDQRYHSVCPMFFSISRLLLTVSYLENLLLLYLFNLSFRRHLTST
nr:G protein-coupled receptor [Proales similis]